MTKIKPFSKQDLIRSLGIIIFLIGLIPVLFAVSDIFIRPFSSVPTPQYDSTQTLYYCVYALATIMVFLIPSVYLYKKTALPALTSFKTPFGIIWVISVLLILQKTLLK